MQRASQFAMLIIGLLGCVCTLADDSEALVDRIVPLSDYDAPLALNVSSDAYQLMDAFEFQDNTALGRLMRLREVSFLTLAESRQSRVFLGVNSDGFVGLHVRAR